MKLNGLSDPEIVHALFRASQDGPGQLQPGVLLPPRRDSKVPNKVLRIPTIVGMEKSA